MVWQKKRLDIPEDFSPDEREELAQMIIDHIRERTDQGIGCRNGRNFKLPGYSASYIKSANFKAAGKSASNVNLRLTNEMLDDIQILSHKKGSVVIGFENGSNSNAKAEGNQLGTYGRPSPIRGKARPFLDISKSDLNRLIREFS